MRIHRARSRVPGSWSRNQARSAGGCAAQIAWHVLGKTASKVPSPYHLWTYSCARLSAELIPSWAGLPSASTRYMPFPWPATASPATSRGSTPAFFITSAITCTFADHRSSMFFSACPGQGKSISVFREDTAISAPLVSYSAAFVTVPPLSIPMRYAGFFMAGITLPSWRASCAPIAPAGTCRRLWYRCPGNRTPGCSPSPPPASRERPSSAAPSRDSDR